MLSKIALTACFALSSVATARAAVMSEILPNTDNDTTMEYITLRNNSCVPEDISGFTLTDASGKVYVLPTGIILNSFVEQKFFRPETKITLNNENESLFLRDKWGNLLDSYSYTTSLKDIAIIRTFQAPVCSVAEEVLFPAPEPISLETPSEVSASSSWEILANTGSAAPLIWTSNQEEQVIESNTGSTQEILDATSTSTSSGVILGGAEVIQESTGSLAWSGANISSTGATLTTSSTWVTTSFANIRVQSGLDSSLRCYKENCSINFEFPSPKSGDTCSWNFEGGEYDTEDLSKCNPSYVHYGYGSYKTRLRVCRTGIGCDEKVLDFQVLSTASESSATSGGSTTVITTPVSTVTTSTSSAVATSNKTLANIVPPKILFMPDSRWELVDNKKMYALCEIGAKKPCKISVSALILEEKNYTEWIYRWKLPNWTYRSGKTLKNLSTKGIGENYIFEAVFPENSKVYQFPLTIGKRMITPEVLEEEKATTSFASSTENTIVKTSSGSSKTKTPKTPKTSSGSTQTKKLKTTTNTGTTKQTSPIKTSAIETNTGADSTKILLLFAASILSFGLWLSISRLFLNEKRIWLLSDGQEEDS